MGYKLKFVLSDLHIGARNTGKAASGVSPAARFIDFLHTIRHESEQDDREIELIINGDLFAFLQTPAVDNFDPNAIYPKEAYLDSSAEASIKRLDIIAEFNPDVFNAMSDFLQVENPQRRLTIIKGNHDINLFWPGVKNRLREILGSSGTRASLLRFADEFVSREKIYVEHGHQRAEKMNGYHDSFDPRAASNPTQLHYPAGARFTIDFLNDAKQEWWFVDHIKPVTALIWYAFYWNFDFACQALASFIRHTPSLVVSDLSMAEGTLTTATHSLLHELEDAAARRDLADKYAQSPAFRREFHQHVQQYLDDAVIDNKGEAAFHFIEVGDNPLEMAHADQQRQRAMLFAAAQKLADPDKARVIVFGHTHQPMQKKLSHGCIYVNTGSWVEDLSDAPPETWRALFNGVLPPGHANRILPYARIEYDADDNPSVQLLYFEG
ncbi:MAG: hypothetical protein FOGNACKC_02138 [Anaerolineae bacterium]|nr:hypothetical protein [Anaerolineae bacterium]